MIIPIILKKRRGKPLPNWVTSYNYVDLTKYVTPDQPLSKALENAECIERLGDIAAVIGEVTRALVGLQPDPCVDCPTCLNTVTSERVAERWVGARPVALPSRVMT
jgi:hypothetical protein